jgi:hypothetical protein
MCGIVGIQFVRDDRPERAREFIEHLLRQSKIRGLHATGAAAVVGGEIRVLKAAVPAQKFLQMPEWADFCDPLPASIILHMRYRYIFHRWTGKCGTDAKLWCAPQRCYR